MSCYVGTMLFIVFSLYSCYLKLILLCSESMNCEKSSCKWRRKFIKLTERGRSNEGNLITCQIIYYSLIMKRIIGTLMHIETTDKH